LNPIPKTNTRGAKLMTINTQYDPLKISEITNRKIDAKNRRTVPQTEVSRPPENSANIPKKSLRNSSHAKAEPDFLNMLLQPGKHNPLTETHPELNEKSVQNSPVGTKDFFSPPKKCEEKNIEVRNGKFNFCIQNTQVGEVNIQGEFNGRMCMVCLSLKNKLSAQEKTALEKILRSSLGKNLGVDLEIKID